MNNLPVNWLRSEIKVSFIWDSNQPVVWSHPRIYVSTQVTELPHLPVNAVGDQLSAEQDRIRWQDTRDTALRFILGDSQ